MSAFPSSFPKPFTGIRSASGTSVSSAPPRDPFERPSASPSPVPGTLRPEDLFRERIPKPFPFVDRSPGNVSFSEDLPDLMAKSLHMNRSPLISAYFSNANLDRVQRSIVDKVLELTKFQIGRQSDDEVLIVMRAVFADRATNNPRDVNAEVARLNAGVLAAVLDNVISGISARLAYLRDASRMRTPIDRGAATSTKGLLTTASLFRPI